MLQWLMERGRKGMVVLVILVPPLLSLLCEGEFWFFLSIKMIGESQGFLSDLKSLSVSELVMKDQFPSWPL